MSVLQASVATEASLARCIGWAILSPLRTMAPISSSTDEALYPEFRSIVSLVTAHTHKVYFSGPVSYVETWDVDYQDVWAQLSGTTLSFRAMNDRTHPWYENITDLVRPPFHLHYLCDPPKPSSLGRPSRQIQCVQAQQCWGRAFPQSGLQFPPGSCFMGCCHPALMLGEIAPQRDLYRPSHPNYH